jgi:hemerythrin-like domain-containing protein
VIESDTAPGAIWAFTEHEHRELSRGIEILHETACQIGAWPTLEIPGRIGRNLDWFDRVLDPHLHWEESALYPEIDARTGTPWATRSARFDHEQIRHAAARIRDDRSHLLVGRSDVTVVDVRCHLFTLEALLRSHIEREERFLIPIVAETDRRPIEPFTTDASIDR